MSQFLQKVNDGFRDSFAGKFFEIEKRKTSFCNELRGALATFMSMAYILAVNPRILADSGGPCTGDIYFPMIGSMIGCFAMGLLANLPVVLAPGMGMNAYFTYSVVEWRGTGSVPYDSALTAVLIEGFIFLILAVTGIRYMVIKWIPEPVRLASPAAIGFFLAHLGLQTAEGIGVVVSDVATAVTLGACPPEDRTPIVAFTPSCQEDSMNCVVADSYTCDEVKGSKMTSPTTWLGLLGMAIMAIMIAYKNRSAFICGIGFVTIISWFRNTSMTYFPNTEDGDARFDYFKQVVRVEPLDNLMVNFSSDLRGAAVALVTFLYVDFLDTSGTLFGLVGTLDLVDKETGDFPRSRVAFACDAIATILGSIFGLSPVTSYIESGAGVAAGSRTGLTAVLCGIFFFLSIFFAPIITSIPPWATGGALLLVGAIMCRSLGQVRWHDTRDATTAFLTVIIMPLTYSIAYGLIAGIGAYLVLTLAYKALELVGVAPPMFEEGDIADDKLPDAEESSIYQEPDQDGSIKMKTADDPTKHTKEGDEEESAEKLEEVQA